MRNGSRILLLGDDMFRLTPLRQTLGRFGGLALAEDLPHALSLLARNSYDVVFCDATFYCGTWREALERINTIYPEIPVIVVGKGKKLHDDEWAEVVAAGGFDLLPSVNNDSITVALLEHALASREGRMLRALA